MMISIIVLCTHMHAIVAFTPSLSHKEKQKRLFLSISILRCWPMILHTNRIKLLLLKTPSVNQPSLLFFTIHMIDLLRKEIRNPISESGTNRVFKLSLYTHTHTHTHWATALRNTEVNFHDAFSHKYEGLEWWSTAISDILERVYMCGEKEKKGGFTPSRKLWIYLYIEQIGNWQLAYPKWLLLNNEWISSNARKKIVMAAERREPRKAGRHKHIHCVSNSKIASNQIQIHRHLSLLFHSLSGTVSHFNSY